MEAFGRMSHYETPAPEATLPPSPKVLGPPKSNANLWDRACEKQFHTCILHP